MKPDVVFCHGPFLAGDYKIGETLLRESASIISFVSNPILATEPVTQKEKPNFSQTLSSYTDKLTATSTAYTDKLTSAFFHSHSRSNSNSHSNAASPSPSPEPTLTPLPQPPTPRRMVMVVVGLKPHRINLWTSSQRPHESVMYYQLMNGCPAIVLPVRLGAPLVAWDGLTLEQLWKYVLPGDEEAAISVTPSASSASLVGNEKTEGTGTEGETTETTLKGFDGVVNVLYEYLDLCIAWSRVEMPGQERDLENQETGVRDEKKAKAALKAAVKLFVAAAVRSGQSKEVRKEVDKTRAGIAMWRIP